MNTTAYLNDPIYLEHNTGWGHPERSDRLKFIHKKIKSASYYKNLVLVAPVHPDRKYVDMVHDSAYIERVKKEIHSGKPYLDSMDTPVCSRSFDVALRAVGGALALCDTVIQGKALNGFAALRPPGHHAEWNYAAGFCIFNNVAIAARYMQEKYKLRKVAIVDWDVHHGNGTQHTFDRDDTVFYASIHQYPHYPGTGAAHEKGSGKGKGYTLNVPMKSGSEDSDYIQAFKKKLVPALDTFKPDIIFISAGFDAHKSDNLSSVRLSSEVFYEFSTMLMDVARTHCNNKIIALLEGGYNLTALANSVHEMMKAFVNLV